MFYSQFGEDRILSRLLPSSAQTGSCVEVGANDGVHGSTTLHFEEKGWPCVLVEPNPDLCKLLRTRRKAMIFECAASSTAGEATLQIAEGAEYAHGVSTIEAGDAATQKVESYGFKVRPVRVPTRRLDDVLEEAALPQPITFITIDVEGHELEVLKGFSVGRWQPQIIIVEDNARFRDPAVRDHLARDGYVPFLRTGVNDWYAHTSSPLVSRGRRLKYAGDKTVDLARQALARVPGLRALRNRLRGLST